MSIFEIKGNSFFLDSQPFRVCAGAMHYFRVPREYWRDRLLKIKACGFNTVETYTAWNLHEKTEGNFNFEGNLDLKAYLDLIAELGMYAIVRPGPYICSEWEFGGFPWWLNNVEGIELRCLNRPYLQKVDAYFDKLIPIIASAQISVGGPVIMVQAENEYGSFGNDKEYIKYIADGLKKRGIDALIYTSDGGDDACLSFGTVPEIFKTANFGSNAESNFKALRRYQPEGPLMCAEFWNGWFDHWGEKHHHRDPADATKSLEEILQPGNNVSVYMMHGGTNFGLMNGANNYDKYEPTVNSYDDDAPIGENGNLTEKYFAFRDLLKSHGFYYEDEEFDYTQPETADYGCVTMNEYANLFDNLNCLVSCSKKSETPLPMEKIGWGYGLCLYHTDIDVIKSDDKLNVDANDMAWVYKDGEYCGKVYRNDKDRSVGLRLDGQKHGIDILVENMGRTNYGPKMREFKGIVSPVTHGLRTLYHWDNSVLPLEDISGLVYQRDKKIKFRKTPVFLKGTFTVSGEPKDTFISSAGFTKGFIWINGKLLSRYWDEGPQSTAYIPSVFLKEGVNEIVLLEMDGFSKPVVELKDTPQLDKINIFGSVLKKITKE